MTSLDTSTDPTAPVLRPGRWTLDPGHSAVTFSVVALGVSRVRGRFNRFDVDLHVGESLDDTHLEASIDVTSIDTAVTGRDDHLRSPELLDTDRRPTLRFASSAIVETESGWRVDGELTFGDRTNPVTLDVSFGGLAPAFDGSRHAGFRATTALRRTEFGIDTAAGIPPGMLGDDIDIELDVQFVEPS